MRWRPELIRCIGKHGGDFIVVLDIDRVFEEGGQGTPADNPMSVPAQDAA
jgi:hypothetical protein